jgi:hypothetical protein
MAIIPADAVAVAVVDQYGLELRPVDDLEESACGRRRR